MPTDATPPAAAPITWSGRGSAAIEPSACDAGVRRDAHGMGRRDGIGDGGSRRSTWLRIGSCETMLTSQVDAPTRGGRPPWLEPPTPVYAGRRSTRNRAANRCCDRREARSPRGGLSVACLKAKSTNRGRRSPTRRSTPERKPKHGPSGYSGPMHEVPATDRGDCMRRGTNWHGPRSRRPPADAPASRIRSRRRVQQELTAEHVRVGNAGCFWQGRRDLNPRPPDASDAPKALPDKDSRDDRDA